MRSRVPIGAYDKNLRSPFLRSKEKSFCRAPSLLTKGAARVRTDLCQIVALETGCEALRRGRHVWEPLASGIDGDRRCDAKGTFRLHDRCRDSASDRHFSHPVLVASSADRFCGHLRDALDDLCDGARIDHAEAPVTPDGPYSIRTIGDRRDRAQLSALASFKTSADLYPAAFGELRLRSFVGPAPEKRIWIALGARKCWSWLPAHNQRAAGLVSIRGTRTVPFKSVYLSSRYNCSAPPFGGSLMLAEIATRRRALVMPSHPRRDRIEWRAI